MTIRQPVPVLRWLLGHQAGPLLKRSRGGARTSSALAVVACPSPLARLEKADQEYFLDYLDSLPDLGGDAVDGIYHEPH